MSDSISNEEEVFNKSEASNDLYPEIPRNHKEFRYLLDQIKARKDTVETDKGSRQISRPAHLINRDLWEATIKYLRSRGEFFRAPYPFYLDKVEHELMRVDSDNPDLARTLRRMGYLNEERHTKLVSKELSLFGGLQEERPPHHLSFMNDEAIYLCSSKTLMIKITQDAIGEVPVGTDGVILLHDPKLGEWPALAELQPHIDSLRPLLGNTCTQLMADLPMTRLLTTRWSQDATLTADQAHQMFLTRFVFTAAASPYPLWPSIGATGIEGSGKSSAFEMLLTMLSGKPSEAQSLPTKEGDLIASITNRSYLVYDNVDDIDATGYNNTLCHISTGAEFDSRVLFRDNQLTTISLRNHLAFTARVNPFTRSDVMRRMIVLETEPPVNGPTATGKKTKKDLFKAVISERPALLAEYIVRGQNVLRAHITFGKKEYSYQSKMEEYEQFTLICAEYEGTLASTQALWAAYMKQYYDTVSERNPMVLALRLWLGKTPANSGREVTSTELFAEVQNIFAEIGQKCIYTAINAFGAAIKKNVGALAVLGYVADRDNDRKFHRMTPSSVELADCASRYKVLAAAAAQRPSYSQNPFAPSMRRREEPMFMDDISDMDAPPTRHYPN